MALCKKGLNATVKGGQISIRVSNSHPLIHLANLIDWVYLAELVQPDLEATTQKGSWWLGRNLCLRIHLAVLILQMLFKWTDRNAEFSVKNTALHQVFCGLHLLNKWHCPDHTKIEKFRNRLSSQTHKAICDYILQLASALGFSDPSRVDVDSTVQEANMSYPADSTLMKKLSLKCFKLLEYLKGSGLQAAQGLVIDMKAIARTAQRYFFLAKNTCIEKKRKVFAMYHFLVKQELKPLINLIESLPLDSIKKLPWNFRDAAFQVKEDGWRYILDVAHFVRTHTMKKDKVLSLHLKDTICVMKGKVGKDKEFGRVFQLGRIGGNFLVAYTCTSLKMNDKESLIPVLEEHQEIFGEDVLSSVTTDKGYYSKDNADYVKKCTGSAYGIQRPINVKDQVVAPQKEELYNRRAGVEPIIGHAKLFGLRKSKMKSDGATLASGYRCVTGFNLHQLVKCIEGTVISPSPV